MTTRSVHFLRFVLALTTTACADSEEPARFFPNSDAGGDDDSSNGPQTVPNTPNTNTPVSPMPSTPTPTPPTPTPTPTTPPLAPPTVVTDAGTSEGPMGTGGASTGIDDPGAGGLGANGGSGDATDTLDASVPEPPEPLVFDDYGVVCEDRNDGQTTTPQFSVGLWLVNNTEERIPLEEISVRYYFTSDNEFEPMLLGHNVYIDDASPDYGLRENVVSNVAALNPEEDGADHYVELSFGSGNCGGVACVWRPTADGAEPVLDHRPIQLRVQIDPSALRYNLADDYSYDPEADGNVLCENITLYRNGRLIFGIEPDGTTPVSPDLDAGAPDLDAGTDAGIADAGPALDDAGSEPDPDDAGTSPIDGGSASDSGASSPDGSLLDAGNLDASLP